MAGSLTRSDRVVTEADILNLVETMPGIGPHRAHVAVGFHPSFPCSYVPDSIGVFVVPRVPRETESDRVQAPTPRMDTGALALFRQRLETTRMLATRVHVLTPIYRPVALRVTIRTSRPDTTDIADTVRLALARHLDAVVGGDGDGWPFGHPLRPSSLVRVAQHAGGEEIFVGRIAIGIDGAVPADDCIDTPIGPHDLVYLAATTFTLLPPEPGSAGWTTWWERARGVRQVEVVENGEPRLVPGGRTRVLRDIRQRVPQYVPEWQSGAAPDAGEALVKLFGAQIDPVVSRIERLDEKWIVEFLSITGVTVAPARPAASLVAFTAASLAPTPVIVPSGFPLSSAAADGTPNDVTWETERGVAVLPGEIAKTFVFDGEALRPVGDSEPFLAFGPEQKPGSYLLLGIESTVDPARRSLGVVVATRDGAPASAAAGGEPAAEIAGVFAGKRCRPAVSCRSRSSSTTPQT